MNKKSWWRHAVIYQIFPRSFKDSNHDGIGDIRGIITKLDYIRSLGINAIWLCPVNTSPNVDSGYDISDYYDIWDVLGTMKDMEDLIEAAHKKDIKIIMDLVVNHTSDKHPWFQEAISSRDSKYRKYYIIKDEKEDGSLPNNWISSRTQKPVWTKIKDRDAYYLHLYTKEQPDLNWENEKVRDEVYKIIHFWLEKGVDGFRMDAINKIAKAPHLPDVTKDESSYFYAEHYFENQPKAHEYLHEMYEKVFKQYKDTVSIGQTSGVTPEEALLYVDENRKELDLFLQFDHINSDVGPEGKKLPFDLQKLKTIIFKWHNGQLWNTNFFGNHDLTRMVSHYGDDKNYHEESAKLLATIQLLLRGTPIIYMGDEIGMTNVNYNTIDEYQDYRSFNNYEKRVTINHENPQDVFSDIQSLSRDNARYPMQWDNGKYAGFSEVQPWIKCNRNADSINVEEQQNNPESILNYYRKLIKLRKSEATLLAGNFRPIYENNRHLFAYQRLNENKCFTVIANVSHEERPVLFDTMGECILNNYPNVLKNILRPYEVVVLKKDE